MSQTLETIIKINAQIGSGFGTVASTLQELGNQVNQLSQKLIDFGKESLEVYKEYEKSLASAEAALATKYGQGSSQLNDVMRQLDTAATYWASTSVFHTDDVANAIDIAAHASWDLETILNNMPAAMELAQAGSIDLSEAVMLIANAQNALQISNDDVGDFIDMWAFAAANSVGDIASFGETLKALGSVGNFADSKEEMFAMIGIMHDMGKSGSQAATLLRTTWMRLLAPSGTAETVMEQLGATAEEIESVYSDSELMSTMAMLTERGFSAFDEQGNAKPLLQSFSELRDVLAEIAGGYDQIDKNQTTLGVLNTLFGMRGINGALNIMNALEKGIWLRDELMNGTQEGYGEYVSDTMMDTYYGRYETFLSKIEMLKQLVGGELAEPVSDMLEQAGNLIEGISAMDSGAFSAVVSALGVIATAGPTLLTAAAAFKILAMLTNPLTMVGTALIGVAAGYAAIADLQETQFEDKFGDLAVDTQTLIDNLGNLNTPFDDGRTALQQFSDQVDTAAQAYQKLTQAFAEELTLDTLTTLKLTPENIESLTGLGEQILEQVQVGISGARTRDLSFLNLLFPGEMGSWDEETQALYASVFGGTEGYYSGLEQEAYDIGESIRQQLTAALQNGELTADDQAAIQAQVDRLNEIMAEIANAQYAQEQAMILAKGQRISWDTAADYAEELSTSQKAALEERETFWDQQWAAGKVKYDSGFFSDETWEGYQQQIATQREADLQGVKDFYGEAATNAIRSLMLSGGQDGTLSWMEQLYSASGITRDENGNYDVGGVDLSGISTAELQAYSNAMPDFVNTANRLLGAFGTLDGSEDSAALLEVLGSGGYIQTLVAQELERRSGYEMAGRDEQGRSAEEIVAAGEGDWFMRTFGQPLEAITNSDALEQTAQDISDTIDQNFNGAWTDELLSYANDYTRAMEAVDRLNGYEDFRTDPSMQLPDWYDSYQESLQIHGEVDVDTSEIDQLNGMSGIPIAVEPYVEGTDAVESLQDQGVQVSVEGDTAELEATIQAEDGQNLMTYINGDATDLHYAIYDENGQLLTENVTGNTAALSSAISAQNGRVITVTVRTNRINVGPRFAEGGRATEASIFGEAGPEWAIPEEHSQRTAELLDAARAASGFTWPELLARNGGLNADANHTPNTLIYSPTINATDARGVEDVLRNDKARLERWFEEKRLRDRVEVYQ